MINKVFAIPTVNKQLAQHFGHCEEFAIVTVKKNTITDEIFITPPAHQPGLYPRFLADKGVNIVIAGGIGEKAIQIFFNNGIEVFKGVPTDFPQKVVTDFLSGVMVQGENQCTH